jgi:hypothetical protein
MNIPFTIDQFLAVFANYNQAIYPIQVLLNILAIASVYLSIKQSKFSNHIISFILSLLWLWTGLVYHIIFFSTINKAAYIFGSMYILQSAMFIIVGIFKKELMFSFRRNFYSCVALIFITYSIFIYPVIGYFLGHIYPYSPTFGAPCPITIFTFGLLLLTDKKTPKYLLIIPLLWSLIGLSAAINFKIGEDFGLVIAGILGVILIYLKDKH